MEVVIVFCQLVYHLKVKKVAPPFMSSNMKLSKYFLFTHNLVDYTPIALGGLI